MTPSKTSPLVSVIIPAYNYGLYLTACIDSLVAQSFTDWEAIIVDDGSTDSTPRIAAELCEQHGTRLKSIRTANLGVASARNSGIERTSGEFILPLDADDVLRPDALERFVEALRKHPECGYAYCAVENIDRLPDSPRFWLPGPFRKGLLEFENHAASTTMWRRSLWQAGVHYREFIYEDWDLALQIVAHGSTGAYIAEPLFGYRQHTRGRMSQNRFASIPGFLEVAVANPSLYPEETVLTFQRALAHAPSCWNEFTVVFIVESRDSEFLEYWARMAHEFSERGRFVVVHGYQGDSRFQRDGIICFSRAEIEREEVFTALRKYGARLLLFHRYPDWCEQFSILENVHAQALCLNEESPRSARTDLIQLQLGAEGVVIADSAELSPLPYSEAVDTIGARAEKFSVHKKSAVIELLNSVEMVCHGSEPEIEARPGQLGILLHLKRSSPESLQRSLDGFSHFAPKVPVSVVCASGDVRAQAYLEQCNRVGVISTIRQGESDAALLNGALKDLSCEWVAFLDERSLIGPRFFAIATSFLERLSNDIVFKAAGLRLPPLPNEMVAAYPTQFSKLVRSARQQSPDVSHACIFPRRWFLDCGGFDSRIFGSGFEFEQLAGQACRAGKRMVTLPAEQLLREWGVEASFGQVVGPNRELAQCLSKGDGMYTGRIESVDIVRALSDQTKFNKEILELESQVYDGKLDLSARFDHMLSWARHALARKLWSSAQIVCEDVLHHAPQHDDASVLLGLAEAGRGAFGAARHHFYTVLLRNPEHTDARRFFDQMESEQFWAAQRTV